MYIQYIWLSIIITISIMLCAQHYKAWRSAVVDNEDHFKDAFRIDESFS